MMFPERGRRTDQAAACKALRAAFSPIMIDGALVLPDVNVGMIAPCQGTMPAAILTVISAGVG
jgi:hypothetical protein